MNASQPTASRGQYYLNNCDRDGTGGVRLKEGFKMPGVLHFISTDKFKIMAEMKGSEKISSPQMK